jgi:hypothetical protein
LDQVFNLLLTTASSNALVDKMVDFKGLIIGIIAVGNNGIWMV